MYEYFDTQEEIDDYNRQAAAIGGYGRPMARLRPSTTSARRTGALPKTIWGMVVSVRRGTGRGSVERERKDKKDREDQRRKDREDQARRDAEERERKEREEREEREEQEKKEREERQRQCKIIRAKILEIRGKVASLKAEGDSITKMKTADDQSRGSQHKIIMGMILNAREKAAALQAEQDAVAKKAAEDAASETTRKSIVLTQMILQNRAEMDTLADAAQDARQKAEIAKKAADDSQSRATGSSESPSVSPKKVAWDEVKKAHIVMSMFANARIRLAELEQQRGTDTGITDAERLDGMSVPVCSGVKFADWRLRKASSTVDTRWGDSGSFLASGGRTHSGRSTGLAAPPPPPRADHGSTLGNVKADPLTSEKDPHGRLAKAIFFQKDYEDETSATRGTEASNAKLKELHDQEMKKKQEADALAKQEKDAQDEAARRARLRDQQRADIDRQIGQANQERIDLERKLRSLSY